MTFPRIPFPMIPIRVGQERTLWEMWRGKTNLQLIDSESHSVQMQQDIDEEMVSGLSFPVPNSKFSYSSDSKPFWPRATSVLPLKTSKSTNTKWQQPSIDFYSCPATEPTPEYACCPNSPENSDISMCGSALGSLVVDFPLILQFFLSDSFFLSTSHDCVNFL